MRPQLTNIDITTETHGFYRGYNLPVSVSSKIIMLTIVAFALIWPSETNSTLSDINLYILDIFNEFYIVSVGGFLCFLFLIAIIPSSGKRVLGKPGEKPTYSNISWFSMMFGAGLGVGLMVYSTAEPIGLWGSNPLIVTNDVKPYTEEAIVSTFRYAFTHFGFHMWAIYVVIGANLAYLAYSRDMPLTMRTALAPIFGKLINGTLGHIIDIMAVVATILGISVTIGYGISQLVDGLYRITNIDWIMTSITTAPKPSVVGLITALFSIMTLSVGSAISGVGKGVKYLSNFNLVLSIILLICFITFGSFAFSSTLYANALYDYILHILEMSFSAYSTNTEVGEWQKGWTTFYWAWQVAFAPFVGLFLARISKGRSLREFILGAVIAPSLVCFLWLVTAGGSAINLEISGFANGDIINSTTTNMLFENLKYLLGEGMLLNGVTIMCVILVITFLVTSADSGIIVINTIVSGGNIKTGVSHRIVWGIIITAVISSLLIAGSGENTDPLGAIKNTMMIGALPFTMIMILMCFSLGGVLISDHRYDMNKSILSTSKE